MMVSYPFNIKMSEMSVMSNVERLTCISVITDFYYSKQHPIKVWLSSFSTDNYFFLGCLFCGNRSKKEVI